MNGKKLLPGKIRAFVDDTNVNDMCIIPSTRIIIAQRFMFVSGKFGKIIIFTGSVVYIGPVRKGTDMDIFKMVRAHISARSAAEHYGIKVNRNGMACCPFHPDRHPSMKLDDRFHCFGCQADGDAVDLTAGLFEIGKYEAAVKLLDDFGIAHDTEKSPKQARRSKSTAAIDPDREQKLRCKRAEKQLEHWFFYARDTLVRYERLLESWKEKYRPRPEDEAWHPLFEEALQMQAINVYHLDILYDGSDDEKLDFFIRKERR